MKTDNKTCVAFGRDPILVYTTQRKIKAIHLQANITEVVQKTRQAIGVTFDGQSFYWTDVSEGRESIMKYSQGSSQKETVLTAGIEMPEDLAIDWLTGNIYFTDAARAHVAVCTGNGYSCTQLIYTKAMERPRALVLYPPEALMFWTDWGARSHIGVAFMDGSSPAILVDDVLWPNGLALDWPSRRLYWADARTGVIECVTITGKDRRTVIDDIVSHPFGLAVFENRLYWSDWETRSIESADKFTGKDHKIHVQGEQIFGKILEFSLLPSHLRFSSSLDVHIFHEAIMPKQNHACMINDCSHICLLAPNSTYSCACPENMELNSDKHTCHDSEKKNSIILGVGNHYVSIPHQTFGRHRNTIAEHFGRKIDLLAYNSLTGGIFFTDHTEKKLYMLDRKREEMIPIVDKFINHVDSIAFGKSLRTDFM